MSGATDYRVYRRIGATGDFLAQATTTTTSHVDAGLLPDTYHYAVTTLDSTTGFESAPSGIASATVVDGTPAVLHVSGIAVTLANQGKNWSGAATVTVLDAGGAPASGASVTAIWSHEPAGGGSTDLNQVVAATDGNGQLTTSSSRVKASSNDGFRLTVSDVSRGGDSFDDGNSVLDGAALVP